MARILIYGAGAVGQLIGGLISRTSRHEVTMVGKYDHYNAIKRNGLTLKRQNEKDSDYFRNPNFIAANERIPRKEPYDWIFFTLKAYNIPQAMKDLSFLINNKVKILLFQMGIGSHGILQKVIDKEKIFLASLTANMVIINPGTVIETNKGGELCLAPLMLRNNMSELNSIFTGTAIEKKTFEDWKPMKWSALLYEMLLNGLCAIVDYTPENLFSRNDLVAIEVEAFKEAINVARALEIKLFDLPAYPIKNLILYSKLPGFIRNPLFKSILIKKDSVKVPTLKNDMEKGRKGTEIEFINGAISRWGKKRKVRTPVNDFLTDELTRIVKGKIKWDTYRKKPDLIDRAIGLFKQNYRR